MTRRRTEFLCDVLLVIFIETNEPDSGSYLGTDAMAYLATAYSAAYSEDRPRLFPAKMVCMKNIRGLFLRFLGVASP